jgi:DNA helicase HerA-like ATPase
VVDREECREEPVFRLSLSDLSAKLRKVTVYGIVEYLFRRFKYGEYRVRGNEDGPANALPTLFVLEEARSLIPNTSSESDDVAGNLARSAMRRIAYEGRKFSLGFGLVSQKPSTVDQEVASQANTFILHQLKSPDDQQYVRKVTESMAEEELDMIPSLGTGRAVVSGLAVQSPVLLDVSFRHSDEGVEAPTPIQDTIGEAVMNARDRLGNSED